MNWTARDSRRSRKYTVELTEMANQGLISWESLALDALGWMGEDEVKEFARGMSYITEEPEDE